VCEHHTDEAELRRGKVSVVLRLLLVEDHAAFRSALALMLNRQPGLEVAAQCGSLAECHGLGGFADIDVALLDLGLPDGDGAELIGELHQANPHVKVLVLTGSVEPNLPERILKVGADGLLDKSRPFAEIAAEVRRLGEGDI
jgi:DNA-binding NarL/FixJ family response regulator